MAGSAGDASAYQQVLAERYRLADADARRALAAEQIPRPRKAAAGNDKRPSSGELGRDTTTSMTTIRSSDGHRTPRLRQNHGRRE